MFRYNRPVKICEWVKLKHDTYFDSAVEACCGHVVPQNLIMCNNFRNCLMVRLSYSTPVILCAPVAIFKNTQHSRICIFASTSTSGWKSSVFEIKCTGQIFGFEFAKLINAIKIKFWSYLSWCTTRHAFGQ